MRNPEQCRLDAVLVRCMGVAPRDGALVGIPNFGGLWLAHDDGAVASLGNDKWHRTSIKSRTTERKALGRVLGTNSSRGEQSN